MSKKTKNKQLEASSMFRRKQSSLHRNAPRLSQRVKILIVCEGKNTEPSYFKLFRNFLLSIEVIGEGYNTLSLVNRAKELKETKYKDYEVWCVFDADPKPDNPQQLINFNRAIEEAEKLGFKLAVSHQAFEYWILLHFEDHQGGAMDRQRYCDKINKHLAANGYKVRYDKDKKIISEELFDILLANDDKTEKSRQKLAIERAEKIYKSKSAHNLAQEESFTTVYQLVKRLLGIE